MAEKLNESALEKTLRALLLIKMESMKQREQIALLDKAGFGQSEIAQCVGSTPGAVSVWLAEIRRKSRTSRGRNSK
jgi:DNA-directed RNA polymerase specialized sigma24 family protein